jgi:cytoskeleton protein RodZ
MDLNEIGTALRQGRERKGLSVEEVEEKTKISPSVIVALEEGNKARFPHPVYAKGFVRSYALLLGLDAAELCAHFSREYPVPSDNDQPEIHAPQITVKMHDSGRVVTAVRIAAIVGILALGALGWYVFDVYRTRSAPAPAAEVAPPQAPAPAPAQVAPTAPMPAPLTQMQEVASQPTEHDQGAVDAPNATGADAANATGSEAPAGEGAAPAGKKDAAAAKPEASVTPASEAAPASRPAADGRERVLRISAHSASWLQARPDDRVVDYFLRKGESATITFRSSLSVKFGNAGGVKLELDGQPYPFDAALGEVKTLVVE